MTEQSDAYKAGFNDALERIGEYCAPVGIVHTPDDINELRIAVENAPNTMVAVCLTTNFLHSVIKDLKI